MRVLLAVLSALIISGCSVLSKGTLKQVDPDISLDIVEANPDRYVGKKVLWGGIILKTENLEDVTQIEVLETELSFDESPRDGASRGRFIVESKRYLDANVYKENKRITVAGTIKGYETRKIGKMDYRYPVVTPIEMKLFDYVPQPQYQDYYMPYTGYPYGYPYGPYGPYSPFSPSPYPYPYPGYPFGPYPYRWPY